MNEALRHRVPGFALLTSTQEAKAAEGSERRFLVIVAGKTLYFQGSLFKHQNVEGMHHKPLSKTLALQRPFF